MQRLPFRIFLKPLTRVFSEPYQTTKIEFKHLTAESGQLFFIKPTSLMSNKVLNMPLIN